MATNSYGWASPTGGAGGNTGGTTQPLSAQRNIQPTGQQQSVSTGGGTLQSQASQWSIPPSSTTGPITDRSYGARPQTQQQYNNPFANAQQQQAPQFNAQQYMYSPPQQMLPQPFGGQQGGQQPPYQANAPYQPYGGQQYNPHNSPVFTYNAFDPNAWANEKDANKALAYSQSFYQPTLNYMSQDLDRQMQDRQWGTNFAEQQLLNRHNMGLADRGQGLNEASFNAGLGQWSAQFGEGQRQFNAGMGFNYDQLYGQLGTQRDIANLQYGTQRDIAGLQYDTQRYGIDTTANTARQQQELERYGIDTRSGVDIRGQDVQERLGNLQYGTQRYGIDTEAATARARMENDLLQARYATFGRSQTPNFQQMASWR